jgi:hypothetical protein
MKPWAGSGSLRRSPHGNEESSRTISTAGIRFPATIENRLRYFVGIHCEEIRMQKTLAILAMVATVGATAVTAPTPAEARGIRPGLAFGLAAGALAAGAAGAAYGPYGYYGPRYGYYGYGPGYYRPSYGYGPYAYYGGPYYRHHYWRHYW